MPQAKEKPSVQHYLKIKEIKDGLLVLEDGSLRTVIMVTSINFALKGEDEKNSIVSSFSNFLNSLTFPVEIVIRSKKLDLSNYVEKLVTLERVQKNPMLKSQIGDYISFVNAMLEVVNIMDKDFFVVVPFFTGGLQRLTVVDKMMDLILPGRKNTNTSKNNNYDSDKTQILQRSEQTMSLLSNIGVRSVLLNTEELIELFYSIYNPVTSRREKIQDTGNYTATVIKTAETKKTLHDVVEEEEKKEEEKEKE